MSEVPSRQSYPMAVVTHNERSAAAGLSEIDWRRDLFAIFGVFLGHPLLLDGPFLWQVV